MAWWFFLKKDVRSGDLANSGQSESFVNNWNVNTTRKFLQENQRVACEEIALLTNISKTSIIRILHKISPCVLQMDPCHRTNPDKNSPTLWVELNASKGSGFP